jgi:hypothetical protein
MRIIKAKIRKERTESTGTTFAYPPLWDINKINVVGYEDTDNLGTVEEWCIGLIYDDVYAATLIDDINVIAIDEATANDLGGQYNPQQLVIDDDMLPDILVAISKPIGDRTQEEEDMLNPDNDASGIRRTAPFDISRWYPT